MTNFTRFLYTSILTLCLGISINSAKATDLADQPLAVSRNVAGNVALALSVEFPTALGSAYYNIPYATTTTFLGYFNPDMCYDYRTDAATSTDTQTDARHYFMPSAAASAHVCTSKWSGNFLNWALTQTIDPFRSALTGGYRVVDEVGLTVLEKAYATGQGGTVGTPTITNNATLISQSTPFSVKNIMIRINRAGTSFIISTCDPTAAEHVGYIVDANGAFVLDGKGNKIAKPSCVDYINSVKTATGVKPLIPAISSSAYIPTINPVADTAIPTTVGDNQYYALHAAVRVCVANLLESNCVAYGSNYKPEGLIQKNALKLNFAAFGYAVTNQNDTLHVNKILPQNGDIDGGVLRARMRSLGPQQPVPNSPSITNPNPEWDASTGVFFTNPDKADADASGVTNSGVINYLNKFGKISGDANAAIGYKRLDSVGELYYTATRYFKNLGPVAAYTTNITTAMKDGFPIITDWDDPISFECQKQFIIGVGDTNAWLDASLPGSTINQYEGHAIPPEVAADQTVDVRVATNKIGSMQDGTSNLGEIFQSTSRYNTFFIAGLAYDAHTRDLRPANGSEDKFPGNQTITTYWLDVLESGFITANRNQYYLAAKYGGFDVPTGYDPYGSSTKAPVASQWDKNGDGDPDNYFRANNPALMIAGLKSAFADALRQVDGATTTLSLTSANITSTGSMSYSSRFVVKDNDVDVWIGDVIGSTVSSDTSGNISISEVWRVAAGLDSLASGSGWSTKRVVATSTCVVNDSVSLSQTCTGIPFRYSSLDDTMKATLGASGQQQSLLDYLRGDRSLEGTSYRVRKQLLSDIVNSSVVAVGTPSAPYTDTYNPGYSSFKATARNTMIYVGANDGFLHAFDGTKSGNGKELFAYAPNALFSGPNNTPSIDGLAALSNTSFVHHFYVDSTPLAIDVNFSSTLADWHTLLIGGLGKGGKAYYCLDITKQNSLTSESAVASAVKWEFKNANLGYTYGQPAVVKVKQSDGTKKWVVIVTSGYNNDDKQGHFFILDPATGKLIQDIPTGEIPGKGETEAGLSQVTAYVSDKRDWTADAAYASDLKGNVWRLDLSGTKNALGSYTTPTKIISIGQPITMPPVVEVDQNTLKRYVFVGTGRLLAVSDINTSQDNYIFAFNDGSNAAFYDSSTTPVPFPWTKSNLVDDTSTLIGGIGSNQSSNIIGYYISLGGYRVNVPMRSGSGILVVGANQATGDACNPDGKGRLYAFNYGTGASVLLGNPDSNGNTSATPFINTDGNISGVGLLKNASTGKVTISYGGKSIGGGGGDSNGPNFIIPNQGTSGTVILLNWRELPTNN